MCREEEEEGKKGEEKKGRGEVQGWQEDGFMAAFSLRWISTLPSLFFVCLVQLSEWGSQTDKKSLQFQDWKREKIKPIFSDFFFFFFKAGILAVLQTDVACHLLVVQGSSL